MRVLPIFAFAAFGGAVRALQDHTVRELGASGGLIPHAKHNPALQAPLMQVIQDLSRRIGSEKRAALQAPAVLPHFLPGLWHPAGAKIYARQVGANDTARRLPFEGENRCAMPAGNATRLDMERLLFFNALGILYESVAGNDTLEFFEYSTDIFKSASMWRRPKTFPDMCYYSDISGEHLLYCERCDFPGLRAFCQIVHPPPAGDPVGSAQTGGFSSDNLTVTYDRDGCQECVISSKMNATKEIMSLYLAFALGFGVNKSMELKGMIGSALNNITFPDPGDKMCLTDLPPAVPTSAPPPPFDPPSGPAPTSTPTSDAPAMEGWALFAVVFLTAFVLFLV